MTSIVLKAFAKLNIGLAITGRRASDGYHTLESFFQEIDLYDELEIEESRSGLFTLSCSRDDMPTDEQNTILKALTLMKPHLPADLGAHIHLRKSIPSGAGLGGGSSDAAAVIRHFRPHCDIDEDGLKHVAAKTGADVPFFLRGGLQFVEGIGDILTPVDTRLDVTFLLVFPPIFISTAEAYKKLNFALTESKNTSNLRGFLTRPIRWELFENAFEDVLVPTYPQIREIRDLLTAHGAVGSGLSGSGSTVYGVYESEELAGAAAAKIQEHHSCRICLPHYR